MKKAAPLFVILAGCFWGSIGIFVRHLNAIGLNSMEIVESRCLLTAVILLCYLALFRRDLLWVKGKDLWCFAGGGILSVVFFNFCYFQTIQKCSLSAAVILLYTAPLFVTVFSVLLFHEKMTGKKIFCLLLAVAGCAFASGLAADEVRLTFPVFLMGIGSGVGYALYSIFSRCALQKGYHPITVTAYIFSFAAIGGAFLTDFTSMRQVAGAGIGNVSFLLLTAVVTTVAPYILYTTGLDHMENSVAAVLVSIEPAVATMVGFFLFNEHPDVFGWLGVALVLIALVLLNLPQKKLKEKNGQES